MTIDLSAGPSWPSAVPSITPDSPARDQGAGVRPRRRHRRQTFSGPVPAAGRRGRARRHPEAAALRPGGEGHDRRQPADDRLHARQRHAAQRSRPTATATSAFTPPDSGNWLLIAYWQRGSGQKPEGSSHTTPDSYVIDHFSKAGTSAITDFWDQHILTPAIRGLLKDAGGAFFEDSLELETTRRCGRPASPTAFEQQIGYSLLPYLPLAVKQARRRSSTTTATQRPRPARHQPRPHQPLQREPHQAAEGVGERARPQAARPALRPADRRDAGERAGGHPRGRVARLQEPRRLPPPGRRARPRGQHDPLQRGGRDRQRRLQHDVGTELRKLAPKFAGGRQPEHLPRLQLPDHASARWPGFPRSARTTAPPATASRGARASRPGSTPRTSPATSPATSR